MIAALEVRKVRACRWAVLGALATMWAPCLAAAVDAVSPAAPAGGGGREVEQSSRRYRADAVITFLGIPIYSRQGVGSGYAIVEQWREGTSRVMSLQFAAGSLPKRAAGLNRLGFLQEMVKWDGSGAVDVGYFGFMTTSKEESLEEGRKALAEGGRGEGLYKVVVGGIERGQARSRTLDLTGGGAAGWADWSKLLPALRGQVREMKPHEAAESLQRDVPEGVSSFLSTLVRELHGQAGKAESYFVYGKGRHRLEVERTPDPKMGRSLVSRNLARDPERVMRLQGAVRDSRTGKRTKFRVWFEAGGSAALPLRFELQPRSFLQLAFEYDPQLDTPAFTFTARR
jgi:hypothetical protein